MSHTKPPINWNHCLQRCNNNATLAHDLLNMLAKELPQNKLAIQQAQKESSTANLQQHIHKLHGACACCGADSLQRMLAQLESKLSQQQTLSQQTIDVLLEEIDRTLLAIQTTSYLPAAS